MKKFFKITISCLIFFFLVFSFDFIFFKITAMKVSNIALSIKNCNEFILNDQKVLPSYFIKLTRFVDTYNFRKAEFRPIMNKDSNSSPIAIFGCSYAYGYIFPNEQTLSYVLSKYSNRPIYNRAMSCWGVQHMLYQLKEDKTIYDEIKNPKYVFYVLMDNFGHFERLYYTSFPDILNNEFYFTYKVKDGEFLERKPLFNLYYDLAVTRHIYNKLIFNKVKHDMFEYPNKKMFDFFALHFKEANKLIKQNWGNDTQFIILTFENTQREHWESMLENENIKIIDIAETIGLANLKSKELGFFEPEIAAHPNGKVWELLVPKLKEMYPDL